MTKSHLDDEADVEYQIQMEEEYRKIKKVTTLNLIRKLRRI